ncbi:MAG: hypothetical protein WC378_12315 [Opitutaceae bacterium]|jgi:hypothetical protein
MIYWQADAYNRWGGISEATLGNDLSHDSIASELTGRINSVSSAAIIAAGNDSLLAHHLAYTYFTWMLGQSLKDTLCGTKVLSRDHYNLIVANRAYFGDFDPFGDFDLLFGAGRLNLKIADVPIRYRERVYGATNIHRWTHGWLLLRMVWFAARKLKFV